MANNENFLIFLEYYAIIINNAVDALLCVWQV